MTIDDAQKPMRKLPFWYAALSAVGGWVTIVLLTTVFLEPTRDVFVFGMPNDLVGLAEADVAIVDTVRGVLRVRSDNPRFVQRLYAQGALMIIPAGTGGCRRDQKAIKSSYRL